MRFREKQSLRLRQKKRLARFAGKKVALLGWGINGLDAANYLLKEGAKVTVYDEKNEDELDFSNFDNSKVELVLGKNYLKDGLGCFDYIFRAPGVYRYIPEIVKAEKGGVIITSVTKLFFDLCPGKIIGVTGTKGKGTTSTLIYEIMKAAGKDVYLAGNIGVPILELLPKLKRKSWVVLELSSFQLIDLDRSPWIGVVLNITEDHMDWHKDRSEYVEAKKNIVKHHGILFGVLNNDYRESRNFKLSANDNASVLWFSTKHRVKGCFVDGGGNIVHNLAGKNEPDKVICATDELLLRGEHNWENVCAAICASSLTGLSIDALKREVRDAVLSFKGLEHRLELVGEIDGVKFYNDSFSTNPQTTTAAIHSFEESLTLILGGSDKGLNYDEMGDVIAKSKNTINVVLIGDIAGVIKRSIEKAGYKGSMVGLGKPNMQNLVEKCFEMTPKSGVVLLSPATASFDMFANYKERGKQFKEAVVLLKKKK